MLGRGKNINSSLLKKKSHISEGLENIRVVYYLKKKYNIDMPITDSGL